MSARVGYLSLNEHGRLKYAPYTPHNPPHRSPSDKVANKKRRLARAIVKPLRYRTEPAPSIHGGPAILNHWRKNYSKGWETHYSQMAINVLVDLFRRNAHRAGHVFQEMANNENELVASFYWSLTEQNIWPGAFIDTMDAGSPDLRSHWLRTAIRDRHHRLFDFMVKNYKGTPEENRRHYIECVKYNRFFWATEFEGQLFEWDAHAADTIAKKDAMMFAQARFVPLTDEDLLTLFFKHQAVFCVQYLLPSFKLSPECLRDCLAICVDTEWTLGIQLLNTHQSTSRLNLMGPFPKDFVYSSPLFTAASKKKRDLVAALVARFEWPHEDVVTVMEHCTLHGDAATLSTLLNNYEPVRRFKEWHELIDIVPPSRRNNAVCKLIRHYIANNITCYDTFDAADAILMLAS